MPYGMGRGSGSGRGAGLGRGMFGGGRGGGAGMGAGGYCVCVKCGYRAPKKQGVPCKEEKCPNCGAVLLREGGEHYIKAMQNKNKNK